MFAPRDKHSSSSCSHSTQAKCVRFMVLKVLDAKAGCVFDLLIDILCSHQQKGVAVFVLAVDWEVGI